MKYVVGVFIKLKKVFILVCSLLDFIILAIFGGAHKS
jgi:hypothetical protein